MGYMALINWNFVLTFFNLFSETYKFKNFDMMCFLFTLAGLMSFIFLNFLQKFKIYLIYNISFILCVILFLVISFSTIIVINKNDSQPSGISGDA